MLKHCMVCGKEFLTTRGNKAICSWICKQERHRQLAREEARVIQEARARRDKGCEACGFTEVVGIYYKQHKAYVLCPNHLAMIKQKKCTIADLISTDAATA